MPQFLIDPTQIQKDRAVMEGDEAKHLVKVLRHQVGDSIWVTDGKQRYHATIQTIQKEKVTLTLLTSSPLPTFAKAPALGIALLKLDHLEWVLQKGVELGIQEFFPIITERTISRLDPQKGAEKQKRFQKILLAAAKQCGMVAIPKIEPPIPLKALLPKFSQFSSVLLAWEGENTSFHDVFKTIDPSKVLILIGPEGGWSKAEVDLMQRKDVQLVSLGKQILRSETAALVALTLSQYELGNI